MSDRDRYEYEKFLEIFHHFQERYPAQQLRIVEGTCIEVKGELKFNYDGYNLLYNLQRLCAAIEEELI